MKGGLIEIFDDFDDTDDDDVDDGGDGDSSFELYGMRIAFCFSFSYCSCCFVLFRLRVLDCMCSYTFNMKTQFFHIHFAL